MLPRRALLGLSALLACDRLAQSQPRSGGSGSDDSAASNGARPSAAPPSSMQQRASAVRPGAVITLPRDFGSHPDTAIEWWYVTGSLAVPGVADPYGFQVTFFRSRTDVATGNASRFAATQLMFAHAAVTDPVARRLRHDQRIARQGFDIAEASTADTDVRLRDWHLRRRASPTVAPGSAGHVYSTRVEAPAAGFAFALDFTATQPVLLQGEAGYSRKGPQPGQASLYLSEPQLAVAGTLRLDGRNTPVTGRAWLDHEWSDSLLDPQAVGWDWIGMNLDDGGALTAFQLRRADGSALWTGGSYRAPGGAVQAFADGSLRFAPLRRWRSPATRADYPVEWAIDTPAGRFQVRSRLDAQELDGSRSTGSVYWEGLSDLLDADERRVGRGYLEMTGYAGALRL